MEVVTNGQDVLERAAAKRPDVFLIKKGLPKFGGDQVCSLIEVMPKARGVPLVLYHNGPSEGAAGACRHWAEGGRRGFVDSTKASDLLAAAEHILDAFVADRDRP